MLNIKSHCFFTSLKDEVIEELRKQRKEVLETRKDDIITIDSVEYKIKYKYEGDYEHDNTYMFEGLEKVD